ncbi:hypothetical protein [Deferribacter desulfuricans]|uniref:hypothetical protein n=1 Tax=Deferribacter desulfuricans TaxID=197162 RepID=UPI0002EA55E8|nr:hypothetical protein [Deferribacter desulfuricans]
MLLEERTLDEIIPLGTPFQIYVPLYYNKYFLKVDFKERIQNIKQNVKLDRLLLNGLIKHENLNDILYNVLMDYVTNSEKKDILDPESVLKLSSASGYISNISDINVYLYILQLQPVFIKNDNSYEIGFAVYSNESKNSCYFLLVNRLVPENNKEVVIAPTKNKYIITNNDPINFNKNVNSFTNLGLFYTVDDGNSTYLLLNGTLIGEFPGNTHISIDAINSLDEKGSYVPVIIIHDKKENKLQFNLLYYSSLGTEDPVIQSEYATYSLVDTNVDFNKVLITKLDPVMQLKLGQEFENQQINKIKIFNYFSLKNVIDFISRNKNIIHQKSNSQLLDELKNVINHCLDLKYGNKNIYKKIESDIFVLKDIEDFTGYYKNEIYFNDYEYFNAFNSIRSLTENKYFTFSDIAVVTDKNSYIYSLYGDNIINTKKIYGEVLHFDNHFVLARTNSYFNIYKWDNLKLERLDKLNIYDSIVSSSLKNKFLNMSNNSFQVLNNNSVITFNSVYDLYSKSYVFKLGVSTQNAYIFDMLLPYDAYTLLNYNKYYFNSVLQRNYVEYINAIYDTSSYTLKRIINFNNLLYTLDIENLFEDYELLESLPLKNYLDSLANEEKEKFILKLRLLVVYILNYYYRVFFNTKTDEVLLFANYDLIKKVNKLPIDMFTVSQLLNIDDVNILKHITNAFQMLSLYILGVTDDNLSLHHPQDTFF